MAGGHHSYASSLSSAYDYYDRPLSRGRSHHRDYDQDRYGGPFRHEDRYHTDDVSIYGGPFRHRHHSPGYRRTHHYHEDDYDDGSDEEVESARRRSYELAPADYNTVERRPREPPSYNRDYTTNSRRRTGTHHDRPHVSTVMSGALPSGTPPSRARSLRHFHDDDHDSEIYPTHLGLSRLDRHYERGHGSHGSSSTAATVSSAASTRNLYHQRHGKQPRTFSTSSFSSRSQPPLSKRERFALGVLNTIM